MLPFSLISFSYLLVNTLPLFQEEGLKLTATVQNCVLMALAYIIYVPI